MSKVQLKNWIYIFLLLIKIQCNNYECILFDKIEMKKLNICNVENIEIKLSDNAIGYAYVPFLLKIKLDLNLTITTPGSNFKQSEYISSRFLLMDLTNIILLNSYKYELVYGNVTLVMTDAIIQNLGKIKLRIIIEVAKYEWSFTRLMTVSQKFYCGDEICLKENCTTCQIDCGKCEKDANLASLIYTGLGFLVITIISIIMYKRFKERFYVSFDKLKKDKDVFNVRKYSFYDRKDSFFVNRHKKLDSKHEVILPSVISVNNRNQISELMQLKTIKHENIVEWNGYSQKCGIFYSVHYTYFGTLTTFIQDAIWPLYWDFRIIVLQNILNGMEYLANKKITKINISCHNCVYNENIIFKLTDYSIFKSSDSHFDVYSPPELFNDTDVNAYNIKSEIYRLGILVIQLISRKIFLTNPHKTYISPQPPIFYEEPTDNCQYPCQLLDLVDNCIKKKMRDRWDLGSIKKFYPINQKFFITPLNLILSKADSYLNTKKGILDDYANKYTEIVKRVDVIVSSFYPSYIKFNDLKNWKDDSNKISYNIEEFKLSNHEGTLITKVNTFLALDVVGYTRLCSTINSTKTVTLLNHLFSKLDSKCIQYNTWKVCTIGDAMYLMGDIGLEPCPKKRALNICKIALGVMDELQICPNKNVELRIGIASGCIISRLFGLPHMYRVYGRTIQRAVYMESSSEINKIQIDENTLRLIDGYLSTFQHHDKIWLN